MTTRRHWNEEERQAFFNLLRNSSFKDAIKRHSINTGRTTGSIYNHFYTERKNNTIPNDVLEGIPNFKHKWTDSETKTLLELIKEHPNNFEQAFRIHAENTGRTTISVAHHFHAIRKDPGSHVCMMTIGERKRLSANSKNIYPGTGGNVEPIRKSIWRRIINIIFG